MIVGVRLGRDVSVAVGDGVSAGSGVSVGIAGTAVGRSGRLVAVACVVDKAAWLLGAAGCPGGFPLQPINRKQIMLKRNIFWLICPSKFLRSGQEL